MEFKGAGEIITAQHAAITMKTYTIHHILQRQYYYDDGGKCKCITA